MAHGSSEWRPALKIVVIDDDPTGSQDVHSSAAVALGLGTLAARPAGIPPPCASCMADTRAMGPARRRRARVAPDLPGPETGPAESRFLEQWACW